MEKPRGKDRIIVALDVPKLYDAHALVRDLAPHVGLFKVGLELLTAEGAPQVIKEIDSASGHKANIFYDGKFCDIPNTVGAASAAVAKLHVKMFNVHALSGFKAMSAAADNKGGCLALGVTILTSLDYEALVQLQIFPPMNISEAERQTNIQRLVRNLALLAQDAEMDGVICSPQEVVILRECVQPEFLIVTPGIRPAGADSGDQKRIATPGGAVKAGADYLVIGRPITKPASGTPIEAAQKIAAEIEAAEKELSL